MKKIISLVMVCALCLAVLLSATSCSLFEHPMDSFYTKMEKKDNYQVEMTTKANTGSSIADALIPDYKMTLKVDGNIAYAKVESAAGDYEAYHEDNETDDYTYTTNIAGKWVKEKADDDEGLSDVLDELDLDDLFYPDKFEKVDGEKNTFKQKTDATFENYENVTCVIEDGVCTFTMDAKGQDKLQVTIVCSRIGEVELTLPTVD